jgi:tripartite-type tricarboxylate transporter receptor subunit TctC
MTKKMRKSKFMSGFMPAALLCAGAALLLPTAGVAQSSWPNRPIKLIVPFPPGGSNDIISRLMAERLSTRLGQSVIVDNKGGAGGTMGTDAAAKSAPDGYTLLFVSTSITTNVAAGKKLPYDLMKDLEPIGQVAAGPFAVVVSNALKISSLREFIDLARAKPKTINYGSAGIGGLNHLGTELLAAAAKVQLVHVPYKGMGPAFTDLMGGTLQMALPSLASMTPFLGTGKMTALAMTGTKRSAIAPDLPTVAEAGLPGFELEVWWGILGPARLPAPIVKRLNEELNAVLAMPDVAAILAREGGAPRLGSAEEFRNVIRSEIGRWSQLIKDRNIQMD